MLTNIIIGLLVLNMIGSILMIGVERQAKTPLWAVADCIFIAVIIYLILQ